MILLADNLWRIKATKNKGMGIFATRDLSAGIIVGDYIGKIIKTAEEDTSEKNGLYLLYYHDYASIYPANVDSPGIHRMNHSCAPNCWITIYKGHTLFFTLRKIYAGEELTISYQLSPKDFCKPCVHQCYCGYINCSGTMHLSKVEFEKWSRFSENETKKTKRVRIRYGTILPLLADYPKKIPDNLIYPMLGSFAKPPHIYNSTKIPTLTFIRKTIRSTGRKLYLKALNITILGIHNNTIIEHKGLL